MTQSDFPPVHLLQVCTASPLQRHKHLLDKTWKCATNLHNSRSHSCTSSHVLDFPLNTGSFFLLLKPCHLVTGLFWDAMGSFACLLDVFYYSESTAMLTISTIFDSGLDPENHKHASYAGRRTKFAPVKSLDCSEFSSEFSDLKTLTNNVKVNPVISWNGRNSFHRIFLSNSQDSTTPQISFEFSGFYYTSNIFLIKPPHTNDQKTRPFREILSRQKGRGEDRGE